MYNSPHLAHKKRQLREAPWSSDSLHTQFTAGRPGFHYLHTQELTCPARVMAMYTPLTHRDYGYDLAVAAQE